MSGCASAGPNSVHMSEGAIGTRADMWSEELQETVDRTVLEDLFADTKMKVCQSYKYSLE